MEEESTSFMGWSIKNNQPILDMLTGLLDIITRLIKNKGN